MIGISKLYCGTVEPSDALRYGRQSSGLPSHLLQFSRDKQPVVVWNVTRRCFSEIWEDTSDPLMKMLKEKKKHVTGRCAECRWLDVCGGNFRVRTEAVTGDAWAPDPACYLTDQEIS